jgi:hypothetical protein
MEGILFLILNNSLCGISSVAGDISPSYLTFYAAGF